MRPRGLVGGTARTACLPDDAARRERHECAQVERHLAVSGMPHEGLHYVQPVLETRTAREPSPGRAALYGLLPSLLRLVGRGREALVAAVRHNDDEDWESLTNADEF